MKQFKPGARVRVEQDARIVQLNEKSNPYWYVVEFSDGRRDLVNIARITHLADEVRATIDHDGSIQVISNRLTARGALELEQWLSLHRQDFLDQLAAQDESDQDDQGVTVSDLNS